MIKTVFGTALSIAHNFLYPNYCHGCYLLISDAQVLCVDCSVGLKPLSSLTIQLTQSQTLKVYAVSRYDGPLRRLILRKQNADYAASRSLARLILENLDLSYVKADCIVPIPVHWLRYAWRGFNPSQVMAEELSAKLGIPVVSLLKRTKRTVFQSTLTTDERFENMKNAFELIEGIAHQVKGKNILFVDDLYTSGATMIACSKLLLEHKPASLTAVVACR